MAIIIPSKNIYAIENSPIIKNEIKKIELNATDVAIVTEENIALHTEAITEFQSIPEYYHKDYNAERYYIGVTDSSGNTSGTAMGASVAYARYDSLYGTSKTFYLNRTKNNKYITKTTEYQETESEVSKSPISYTIYGKRKKGVATATWQINLLNLSLDEGGITYGTPADESETEEIITLPTNITSKYVASEPIEINTKFDLPFNIVDDFYILSENKNIYEIKFSIPVGIRTTTMGAFSAQQLNGTTTVPIKLNGEYEIYEPSRVELSIYGDVITLDLSEKSITVGDLNSKTDFSISNNELLQETNLYESQNANLKMANDTINQFKNGKETLTLLCSISDYYEKGATEPTISIKDLTKRMLFQIGDIVEPYYMNEFGEERPISENADSTPKQFKIIGIKKFFDGACWQEIACQENVE